MQWISHRSWEVELEGLHSTGIFFVAMSAIFPLYMTGRRWIFFPFMRWDVSNTVASFSMTITS